MIGAISCIAKQNYTLKMLTANLYLLLFFDLCWPDVARAITGFLKELLMIFFGRIKFAGLGYLGDNWVFKAFFGCQLLNNFFGGLLLLVVEVKNGRAVIVANVRPILVKRGWIVHAKKVFQQGVIADFVGVEYNFGCLGVASGVRGDLFVGRTGHMAAAVSDFGRYHAIHLVKVGLHAPKAAGSEQSSL